MTRSPRSATFTTPPRGDELPYSDGEEMESKRHAHQYLMLVSTLDDAWADRDDYFVADQCRTAIKNADLERRSRRHA